MKMPDLKLPTGIGLRFADTPEVVAHQLAAEVAAFLKRRLAGAPRASLAVSGGSTPVPFFLALSEHDLAWHRVDVLLVDERWVPEADPDSNTRLVKANLLRARAAAARFLSLKQPGRTPEDGLDAARSALSALTLPLDVLILGMGNDGHTASLFPDAPELARAMQPEGGELVAAMTPPSQSQKRITLTRAVLSGARYTALHLKGQDKLETLRLALSDLDDVMAMPVRAFLQPGLEVFWSP